MKRFLYFFVIFSLLNSCVSENTNVVKDAPIRYVKPGKALTIEKDPLFVYDFPQTLACSDVIVANDSVILLYNFVSSDKNSSFYQAYSLEDYSYLGEFIRQGRGPGELLGPDLSGTYRSEKDGMTKCYILDLMLGQSFCFDLSVSIKERRNIINKLSDLPINTLYALPYHDSLQFIMNVENDNFQCHIIDRDAVKSKTFKLYPENISAERHIAQFGNCVCLNQRKNTVSMVMTGIPQVNYLDLEKGTVFSVAVDRKYKDWKQILTSATDMNQYMESMQYYNDAASAEDYIFAVYTNRKIADIMNRTQGLPVHVHIFDWNGDFLYDLTVNEDISRIDYDTGRKHLYGLDVNDGRVYRYDLSGILD